MQQERSVLITGAAGGIGSLLVERFLSNRDGVFAMDRNAEVLLWAARYSSEVATLPDEELIERAKNARNGDR